MATPQTTWREVSQERYDEKLGVVFPAAQTHLGFLMGEPMDHNDEGKPVYMAFACVGGRYYEAVERLTKREFATAQMSVVTQ